ncbi:hypothetical protein [Bartonella machadoae]|nr:hypothetical protein [Bartonella machadoae]
MRVRVLKCLRFNRYLQLESFGSNRSSERRRSSGRRDAGDK